MPGWSVQLRLIKLSKREKGGEEEKEECFGAWQESQQHSWHPKTDGMSIKARERERERENDTSKNKTEPFVLIVSWAMKRAGEQ